MDKNVINICHCNIYHLYNKLPSVCHMINTHHKKIHILGISETKLKDHHRDENIQINNYSLIRQDKRHEYHTGMVAFIHNSIIKKSNVYGLKLNSPKLYQHLFASSIEIQH